MCKRTGLREFIINPCSSIILAIYALVSDRSASITPNSNIFHVIQLNVGQEVARLFYISFHIATNFRQILLQHKYTQLKDYNK